MDEEIKDALPVDESPEELVPEEGPQENLPAEDSAEEIVTPTDVEVPEAEEEKDNVE